MTDRLKAFFDNARKHTFEYNGAKIVVREGLGIDRLDATAYRREIRDRLLDEKRAANPKRKRETLDLTDLEWNRIFLFVPVILRTVSIQGTLPCNFRLPSPDDPDEWYEAFWQFLQFPGDLMQAYDEALAQVNRPEPDPEAKPADEKSTTTT